MNMNPGNTTDKMKRTEQTETPLRVLMVFTILNRGGAETMVMNYFRMIDRSKVIFDFLVHREEKGAYEEEIERLGGRIFRLPALNPMRIRSYKQAVTAFFDAHPEYIMVHGHCSELGYFIYKEAHRRGLKFIAAHAHNSPKGFDLKMPLRNILKRVMRPYLTHYFTCGQESAAWLFGRALAEKVIFLPNAIDASRFAFNEERREEVRREHAWEGRFVIGNVSRFAYQKNHLFMIDILAAILNREPAALLVLVGSGGEMEGKLREKISRLNLDDNVCFMGSRPDIPELLQGMDAFLFPSKFEGLGIAQLEAQASGMKTINSTVIPKEGIVIPELVDSIPLSHSAKEWADKVLEGKKTERKDRSDEIVEAGFDIKNNATWLQNYYITQSQH